MDELALAYAEIGRNKVAFDKLNVEYSKLLCLLADVVRGEVATSRVLVNLTDRTYLWVEAGQTPALPPTINGLPQCIVAPPQDAGTADSPSTHYADGRKRGAYSEPKTIHG